MALYYYCDYRLPSNDATPRATARRYLRRRDANAISPRRRVLFDAVPGADD